jgi:HK97 gp10 family phage protein
MAKFSYNPPGDFLKQLGKLSQIDEIAPQMIDEALPAMEDKLIKELAWHVDTGELQSSVKRTKAKKVKGGGFYAVARPTGEDSKGVRNMEKLAYLEYGTSKQRAKPLMTRVVEESESAVQSKMREVFKREAEK